MPRFLLALIFLTSSALAQTDQVLIPNATPLEAAATGTNTVLAVYTKWIRDSPCGCGEIDAVRVNATDGTLLEPAFRIAPSLSLQTQPAVAFDGRRFLVVWNELADPPFFGPAQPDHLVGAFVDEDGGLTLPFTISAAHIGDRDHPVRPTIVWDGTRYLVFFSDLAMHAAGAAVSPSGEVGEAFHVSDALAIDSASAGPGSQVMVVWTDSGTVQLGMIGPELRVQPPIALASAASSGRVAWNGQTYLAVWRNENSVFARSIDPTGSLGDVHELMKDEYPYSPQLIAVGPLFVAAWGGPVAIAWIAPSGELAAPGPGTSYFPLLTSSNTLGPVLTSVGDRAMLFFYRSFYVNQFYGYANEYVSFITAPRRRVLRGR